MNVKPIRSFDDLTETKQRLATLVRQNTDGHNDDVIEVLSALIERFERTATGIDSPGPVSAIKYRMFELGWSPRHLEPFIGSRARVSEVLSGKRSLSIDMIRSLHEGLGIPYALLIEKKPFKIDDKSGTRSNAIARLNSLGFAVDDKNVASFLQLSTNPSVPALLRKSRSQRAASKTDQTALMLWQAAVLKRAEAL